MAWLAACQFCILPALAAVGSHHTPDSTPVRAALERDFALVQSAGTRV
jgi:hypothetical protein